MRWFVCGRCWEQLPDDARRALDRHDHRAAARLYAAIDRGIPLTEVEIT